MSQPNEQYAFEPIIITQDEIDYYRGLKNNILNNFVLNFRDHIEVIDNQLYYLKHQFFTITRKNLVETLDWDEVHQIQQSYINRKTELLQQKEERFKLLKIFYQKEDITEIIVIFKMTTSTRTFEETFTFPMQRVLNEFQRIEPLEVYLPPQPYDMNQNLTSVIRGR